MKIKAVEIFGFKSFFDKTKLLFEPGITALVGPNGCGKSNIVDAIRWSIGEQSAKHLRGSSMEDVIFNGSRSKKPLGMAEVTLTFSNENGHAPIQYRTYSEIQITRRVFRSGESEYYINKSPCRLKDITELFMDTGVGNRAYSIIEQGRVETIINAKPTEIRFLLEEAAGISKYKARKQEALRKMEGTRQNLVRVNDVIGEIQRQIKSLAYQAQKLKRYKGLRDRIRTFDLALASQQYRSLTNAQEQKKRDLAALREKQSQLLTAIERITAENFNRKTDLQEHEERFTSMQRRKLELEHATREEENTVEWSKEKRDDAERLIEQACLEIEKNQARVIREEEETARAADEKIRLEEQIAVHEARLKEEEQVLQVLKKEHSRVRSDLDRLRDELFEIRNEISRRDHLVERSERTRADYELRMQQNRQETEEAQNALEDLARERAAIEAELQSSRQEKQSLEIDEQKHHARIIQLEEELKQLTDVIATLKDNQARCESLLETLQELQRNFEGCSNGVRSIMQRSQTSECEKARVYGLMADCIETESRYETAVEAALGEKLQYVVVHSHEEGIDAIAYLKTEALGRVSFVPLADVKPMVIDDPQCSHSQAIPLLSVVRIKEDHEPFLRSLLVNTLVVENLSQGLELWRTNTVHPSTLVTLDGEIIDPCGIITGGSQNGSGTGLLRKKREIGELEKKLNNLAFELESQQEEWNACRGELTEVRQLLKEVQDRLVQRKLSLQNKERDVQQNGEEMSRTEKKRGFLHAEYQKLCSEVRELDLALNTMRRDREEYGMRLSRLQEQFSDLQHKEASDRQHIEEREQAFSHSRIDLVDMKGQLTSVTSSLNFRRQTIETCRAEILKNEQIKEEAEQDQEDLRTKINFAQQRMDALVIQYQEFKGEMQGQENLLIDLQTELRKGEEQHKEAQRAYNDLQPQVQDCDHDHTQLLSQMRHLEETVENKYHVVLKDVMNDYPLEQYPEEATREKLAKLTHAQESMIESINFNAERDYEEQTQKLDFYQSQSDDLSRSLSALEEAIAKINRTSKERFRETFDKVSENFKAIFPLVFEGGRGELMLTDEHDLLETGVEIQVQPAGKSLKSITLLSGGEKALSAISLLFALYLYKPSPFCLFDEVDSPLDDANVFRFANILRQFSEDSQFLVITHNKHTMETANTLYGITMEEPGVSKVVSVQLTEGHA